MDLVLIRHTSVDVPAGTCYGRTDVRLKRSFRCEADRVLRSLSAYRFDAVYTSPSSRCTKLAAHCGYPCATRDDRLMEMDFGQWEMQRWDRIADPRLQAWFDDWAHVSATGGESFTKMYARVASFLDDLLRTDSRRVALFTHGGVIACARIYAGRVPLREAFAAPAAYGETVAIQL